MLRVDVKIARLLRNVFDVLVVSGWLDVQNDQIGRGAARDRTPRREGHRMLSPSRRAAPVPGRVRWRCCQVRPTQNLQMCLGLGALLVRALRDTRFVLERLVEKKLLQATKRRILPEALHEAQLDYAALHQAPRGAGLCLPRREGTQ